MSASEAGDPKPAASPAPGPTAAKEPPRKKTKRRSLWRWTRRLLIAAVALRILLWLFLQPLADFGAGFAGLSVSWRSASLSMFGLSLTIDDLVVRDVERADGPPLLAAQEVVADLSMRQLLQGNISVVDVGLAGARVTLHREADGSLRLPRSWLEPAAAPAAEPEPTPADDAPLDFRLPVAIASARLHDLQIDLVDHATTPASAHTGKLDIDVADLGYTDRRGKVHVRLHAPQFCDELFLQADVHAERSRADLEWNTSVRGFRPHQWRLPAEVMDSIDGAHVVDLRLSGRLQAEVLDAAPQVPALAGDCELQLALDGIERTSLDVRFGPTTPEDATAHTPFSLTLRCDRLVEALRLDNGQLALAPDGGTLQADLVADKLTCARIRPLLEASGVALPADGLDLRARVQTSFGDAFSLDLEGLSLATDGDELLKLPRVAVRDLQTVDDALTIGGVEVVGPELPILRNADGSLTIAGLRLAAATTAGGGGDAAAPADPAPAPAAAGAPLPRLRLGSLRWTGARVTFRDETTNPPTALSLEDVDVRADALAIGEDAPPGKLTLAARLPGVGERLSVELDLRPRARGATAALQLATSGLTLQALAPMLAPLGVEAELADGSFALACTAELDVDEDDTIRCAARLANLRLVDGDTTWCKLRALEGRDVRLAGDEVFAGTWSVTEPYLLVQKDERGALHAMGLRLGAAAAPAPAPAGAPPAAPRSARQRLPDTTAPLLRHGAITLAGAMLAWRDAAYGERTFQVGLDAEVGANDASGAPIPLGLTLRLDRAVRSLGVTGALTMSPARTSLDVELDAAGIDGRELQLLLPDGVSCTLRDGALQAGVTAEVLAGDATSVTAALAGLRLADGGDELFAVDRLALDAPSLGDVLHVRDLTLAGVRARITQTDRELHVPGFALASAAPAPPTTTSDTGPASAAAPAAATAEAGAPLSLSKLRIDALSLQLERLEFRDRRGGEHTPLVLRAKTALARPWTGDPTAEAPTPLQLDVDAACDPLGAVFDATMKLSPFELAPTIDVHWELRDLDTGRLADVMPALAEQVRGDATSLRVSADVHANLDLHRRDASRFDFSRPFGGELVVDDFVVRDEASDRTFASVRNVDAIVRAIDPRTGAVLLRSLDIDEPFVRAHKDAQGLHAFGFLLPDADAAAPTPEAPTPAAPGGAPPTHDGDAGEFAVDHLRLLGLAIDVRDETTTPPTHLRLVDTDFELHRFSTRAFVEQRPLSFTAAIRGGDIELERRVLHHSVITGFVGAAADAITGGANEHAMEPRPLVDQVTAQGQLQLFPVVKGRVQAAIDTLELAAFRGLAKQAGVDLADGLYDMRLAVDLQGHDGAQIKSQHVLTWLQLSEPPDGPITTYLRLPAPLPTVLFLLRNTDGELRLPLNLSVPGEGLSSGEITDLAVEKLVTIITDAVAGTGSRVLDTITNPLLGGELEVPDLDAELAFAAGSPLPTDAAGGDALAAIVAAAEADETLSIVMLHDLGAADQAHAATLATPAQEVVQATAARLQASRREIEDRREPIARDVVALYAAGRSQEAIRKHAELQQLDTHLGELETALREALDMLGNDNERRARRRARAAAEALADARLDAVEQRLLLLGRNLTVAQLERRPGRGLPEPELDGGGRVRLVLRRRSAGR